MSAAGIMVVDDDPDICNFLVMVLEGEGYSVRGAAHAIEALMLMQKEKPFLIILDLMMPEISGEELCKIIKNDPEFCDVYIFILSAKGDVGTKITCFENGADEYLTKPIDPRELTTRVKHFIRLVESVKTSVSRGGNKVEADDKVAPPTVDLFSELSGSHVQIKPKYGIYRVEALIGSGGMGHVFKGNDELLGRDVAVKVLSKRLSNSKQFVDRFRREAKMLAAIDHPGIAAIYSFGEEGGDYYFALQWCAGGSLADLIRRKNQIDVLTATDIVLQCAEALLAASRKGIVHRDIKPSNLMFDEDGRVKIVDFGLASAEHLSAHITNANEFFGTPSYMAPEQAQGAVVDQRADIYSLGITFYAMLYGKLPFSAKSAVEMLVKTATQPFPPYDPLGGKIPNVAYQIMEKMTQKDPGARYQDYSGCIEDLKRLQNLLLTQSKFKVPKATNVASGAVLKDTNLFQMLANLYLRAVSGVLFVQWGAMRKRFLIRDREIIFFESSQPDETVWHALVQKKVIKPEDVPSREKDFEESLSFFLLNQAFRLEELKKAYSEIMKKVMTRVALWPAFEGEFFAADIEQDALGSVRIADLVMDLSRETIEYEALKKEVQQEFMIQPTPHCEETLSGLALKPEESFIASRFEGNQEVNIGTLSVLTGLPEEKIIRFVYALEKLGAIKMVPFAGRRTPRRPEPVVVVNPKETTVMSAEPVVPRNPSVAKEPPAPKQEKVVREMPVRMELQKSEKKMEIEHSEMIAEQFYRLAEQKFHDGDYWKVTELCKQAIRNDPQKAKYYHLMALAYAEHPRFLKDAEQCFFKAMELEPWNPDYHVSVARFFRKQGLLLRAAHECKKALEITPQHEEAVTLYNEIRDEQ